MTPIYYITALADQLAKDCDKFVLSTNQDSLTDSLENIVLIQAFHKVNRALRRVAQLLETTEDSI